VAFDTHVGLTPATLAWESAHEEARLLGEAGLLSIDPIRRLTNLLDAWDLRAAAKKTTVQPYQAIRWGDHGLGAPDRRIQSLLARPNGPGQPGVIGSVRRMPQRLPHFHAAGQLGQLLRRSGRSFGGHEIPRRAGGKILVMAELRDRLENIPHRSLLPLSNATRKTRTCMSGGVGWRPEPLLSTTQVSGADNTPVLKHAGC
jgi:hypothetical protein